MTSCWQDDPDARPTFTDLRDQLKDMETMHKVRLEMNIIPMTFFSCKREWKLGCEHSLYRQWFIQTSEEHPLISTCWYNTEFFSVVSPWFHDGYSWKLSLRVLFSIESLTISASKILDNNRLCRLNKRELDDCKKTHCKVEVKQRIKWCIAVNSILSLLLLLWACFDHISWCKSGNHLVSYTFPHFLSYAEADQHENVRQAVVCKRGRLTCVVEHTSSLFNRQLAGLITKCLGH